MAESEESVPSANNSDSSGNIPKPQKKEDQVYIYAGNEWETYYGDETGFTREDAQRIADMHGEETLFFVRIITFWDTSDSELRPKVEEFYQTIYTILKEEGYDVKLFDKTELYGYLTIEQIDRTHSLIDDVPDSMKELMKKIYGWGTGTGAYWSFLGLNSVYAWRKASEPSFFGNASIEDVMNYKMSVELFSEDELKKMAWDAATELFWGKRFHYDNNIWEAYWDEGNGNIVTERITIEEQMLHYTRTAGNLEGWTPEQLINAFCQPGIRLYRLIEKDDSNTETTVYSCRQIVRTYLGDDLGISIEKRENGEIDLLCRMAKRYSYDPKTYEDSIFDQDYDKLKMATVLSEIPNGCEPNHFHHYASLDSIDEEGMLHYSHYRLIAVQDSGSNNRINWYRIDPMTLAAEKMDYDEDSLYYTFRNRLWPYETVFDSPLISPELGKRIRYLKPEDSILVEVFFIRNNFEEEVLKRMKETDPTAYAVYQKNPQDRTKEEEGLYPFAAELYHSLVCQLSKEIAEQIYNYCDKDEVLYINGGFHSSSAVALFTAEELLKMEKDDRIRYMDSNSWNVRQLKNETIP